MPPKQQKNSKLRKTQKQKTDDHSDSEAPDIVLTEKMTENEEDDDDASVTTDPLLEEVSEMSVSDTEGDGRRKGRKRIKKAKFSNEKVLDRKIRARQRIAKETFEERLERLRSLSDYQRERLRKETPEQRKRRLQILKYNQARRLKNETPEMRAKRLNRGRLSRSKSEKNGDDKEAKVEDDTKPGAKRSGRKKVETTEEI